MKPRALPSTAPRRTNPFLRAWRASGETATVFLTRFKGEWMMVGDHWSVLEARMAMRVLHKMERLES